MEMVLRAQNIVKTFGDHTALSGVDIEIPEGSIFGLLGPNGAGKTTFIRIINRITGPDSGSIELFGEKLKASHVDRIGYLPEERGLYKKMTVGEQAIYLAQLKGLSKRDAKIKLKEWFEKFDLVKWWNHKVEELSKGMQQKIQFIITILHEPKLLIFDEPFSGFDPINTRLLKEEILKLKEQGASIIFSTHNMGSVEEICDNIALINNSKKILDGKVTDIKNEYKKNIYEIDYIPKQKGFIETLAPQFGVLNIEDKGDFRSAVVKISDEKYTNDLIIEFMQNSHIMRFQEQIPSMDQIFIERVEKENLLRKQ
jgi:ABC-2 type transport system ATP-binding protein